MWWKIYFWVFAVLTVLGLFGLLKYTPLSVGDLIGVIISIVLFFGTYSYVYKKRFFDKKQWNLMFLVIIASLVLDVLDLYVLPKGTLDQVLPFLRTSIPVAPADYIIGWIISAPAVYAVYQLSQKKK